MSSYVHHVPGRLRVKNGFFKNAQVCGGVAALLATMNGVESCDFNHTTGSILVRYRTAQTTCAEILSLFQSAGYFDASNAVTSDQYIYQKSVTMISAFVDFATLFV
jgi:hypothetical protein